MEIKRTENRHIVRCQKYKVKKILKFLREVLDYLLRSINNRHANLEWGEGSSWGSTPRQKKYS